jgi:hypothetical protein
MMLGLPEAAPADDDARLFRDQPPNTLRLVGNAAHPIVIGSPIA